ncbi:MAG: hypothetical protein R3B95_14345 [Nitrospirales bacterium]|nr:hypothetical protein [Nitrospirales bacterium]
MRKYKEFFLTIFLFDLVFAPWNYFPFSEQNYLSTGSQKTSVLTENNYQTSCPDCDDGDGGGKPPLPRHPDPQPNPPTPKY